MKIQAVIILVLASVMLSAAYVGIDITDNLFKSPDNYYDLVFRGGFSGEQIGNALGAYWGIDGSMPVLNYEMGNLFTSIILNRYIEPNPRFSIGSGIAGLANLYFLSYAENMSLKGDLYTDLRMQNGRMIWKLSADVTGEHFPFLPDARRESGEIRAKAIYSSSIGAAFHLGFEGGILYYDRPGVYSYRFGIEPLISKSFGDNCGLSARFRYTRALADSMPYFIDDSFVNDYYYNIMEGSIGIKFILSDKGTLNLNVSAGMHDFVDIFMVTDTAAFTDRDDTFIDCTVRFSTAGENTIKWEYNYEKEISDVVDFVYDSHTLSVTVGI